MATPGTREDAGRAGPPTNSATVVNRLEHDKEENNFKEMAERCQDERHLDETIEQVEAEGMKPQKLLQAGEAKSFRGVAARLNYLAQDRPDLQFAAKEVSRRMARPTDGDWQLVKRVGRYLLGAPRAVQKFAWQYAPHSLDSYVDSDWAGCKASCRSTSGGAVKLGRHTLRTWSSTQATVAMSSAEAELFSLTKGASVSLGLMSIAKDLGLMLGATVHSDASAALAMAQRQGLGKLRHLKVQFLWVQERIRGGDFDVKKVHGKYNPADLLTKHLAYADMQRHVENLGYSTSRTRSDIAPELNGQDLKADVDDCGDWEFTECGEAVRNHMRPRLTLFTPTRVRGAPPSKALLAIRVTRGVFCDDGSSFVRRDHWTARSTAHASLKRLWTGTSTFLFRTDRDDPK